MKSGKKTIGCFGEGNMGGAILSRLAAGMDPGLLAVYDIDAGKASAMSRNTGITASPSPDELARSSNAIIIAVKPDAVAVVLGAIKGAVASETIIVSIAAGVSIGSMEKILGESAKIVRVMPNTPSMVGEGMSVLSPNRNIDDDSLLEVEQIFSKIGRVLVLPEKLMDAVTGLSGSGPAYVFTFIQALADGGVKLGIPRDKALVLAAQDWASQRNLLRMIIEMQSKNFPGIHLAMKMGYEFCGYNDQYYASRDIALFFARFLR